VRYHTRMTWCMLFLRAHAYSCEKKCIHMVKNIFQKQKTYFLLVKSSFSLTDTPQAYFLLVKKMMSWWFKHDALHIMWAAKSLVAQNNYHLRPQLAYPWHDMTGWLRTILNLIVIRAERIERWLLGFVRPHCQPPQRHRRHHSTLT
jgi:hypothetical protein